MEELKLPTDNLYKFIAILGSLLAFYSVISPLRFLIENYEQAQSLLGEKAIIVMNSEYLTEDMAKAWEDTKKLEERALAFAQKDNDDPLERSRIMEKLTELFNSNKKMANNTREQAIKKVQLRIKEDLIRTKKNLVKIYAIFGCLTAFIGISLAYWGFRHWYFKLQKYQDIFIQNKANNLADGKGKRNG